MARICNISKLERSKNRSKNSQPPNRPVEFNSNYLHPATKTKVLDIGVIESGGFV